jgi:hypothetical protein
MKACILLLALAAVSALSLPAAAVGKGFTRVVVVGSDGRWVQVNAAESVIGGLLSSRGRTGPIAGGYLRLFFVGPGDVPANSARYYPERRCVALDWPRYETSCGRIDGRLVRLLRPARALPRFRIRPTVLASLTYHGSFGGPIRTAAALKPEVELALDRGGRQALPSRRCYVFSGVWRGPAAAARPRSFLLCPAGIYAHGRVYPLSRGVWAWFRLNAG